MSKGRIISIALTSLDLTSCLLLRGSSHEQRPAGGGQSFLQILSGDAGGTRYRQLRPVRQPAGSVRVLSCWVQQQQEEHCLMLNQRNRCFLSFNSKMKDNKNASEIIKTVNMLVSAMNSEYLWEYMTRRFCTSLRWARRQTSVSDGNFYRI